MFRRFMKRLLKWKNGTKRNFSLKTRDLKVDGCQSNLYVMLKQSLFFYKFYDFFLQAAFFDEPTVL